MKAKTMKIFAMALLLCLSIVGCGKSDNLKQAQEELMKTPAYELAVAEAGVALDPADPRVQETALLLFDASKFFGATERDIANVAYRHAKSSRQLGMNVSANDLIRAGLKAHYPNTPMGMPTLESFNFYAATSPLMVNK